MLKQERINELILDEDTECKTDAEMYFCGGYC